MDSRSAAADTSRGGPADLPLAEAERALAAERVRAEPLADGERLDPNRASADELQRLPRVGPALAARIVARRDQHGPLRSLADLDSVPGVGPAMLRSLAPLLTLPPAADAAPAGRGGQLDPNRATAAELEALPGIGPVLARRLVEWREAHGPFRSLDELERVPGIGPALRARLAPRLRIAR